MCDSFEFEEITLREPSLSPLKRHMTYHLNVNFPISSNSDRKEGKKLRGWEEPWKIGKEKE
jgi:hypothetical protein